MARPNEIAPCKMKGRSSVRDQNFKGCECATAFSCAGSNPGQTEWVYYALSSEGRTMQLPLESKPPQGALLVIPCAETFLKRKSSGTVFHNKVTGDKSKFKGCHDIEKFLLDHNLVRYEPREKLGRSLDSTESAELFASLSDFDDISGEDLFAFLLDGSRRELGAQDFHRMSVSVYDWQEKLKHVSTQIPEATDPNELVFEQEEIEETIEQLLGFLTTKQRNAIRAVYLDNYEGLSQAQIAGRMGIREDSLKERIQGAFKKLRSLRPK